MYRVNSESPGELILRMCHGCRDLKSSCKCTRASAAWSALLGFLVISAIVAWLVALSGCGDVMVQYHRSIATAAITATACRETLSEASEKKVAGCGDMLKAGDKSGAQACLDTWKATHEKINTACKSLKVAAKIGLEAAPVVEAGMSKKKDALGWIARLGKLGLEVVKALSDAGLRLPAGGGP